MDLSVRESEVIFELVQGYQKKEIADKMCLSIHTVDTHFKNVKAKTGAKNIADLVRMYILSHKDQFFAIVFTVIQAISILTDTEIIQKRRRRMARKSRVTVVYKTVYKTA